MQETRRLRLQSVIQEELSLLISRELKDPRIPSLTITSVELTHDAEQATVYVSILGSTYPLVEEKDSAEPLTVEEEENKRTIQNDQKKDDIKNCLKGLSSAAGFLRRHLARALNVRHVPNLIFRQDRGYENTIRVHELLKKVSES